MSLFSNSLRNLSIKCAFLPFQKISPFRNMQAPLICRANHGNQSSEGVVFEVFNGVGGSEAMLFADEMVNIYLRYFDHMRWPYKLIECDRLSSHSLRSAKLKIFAPSSFHTLIQEAGVHRVQRVPKTEKSGRMHTSTITIAVMPTTVLNIQLNNRDLEFQTKRASGPGGQHVNKTDSAIRLVHKPSGCAVESQESRHQIENRKIAMKKLLYKLQSMEMERLTNQYINLRKKQVGHADRNEKVRTYNFPQDRITDHRLGKSYHNLRGLMQGDVTILQRIIDDFQQAPSNN